LSTDKMVHSWDYFIHRGIVSPLQISVTSWRSRTIAALAPGCDGDLERRDDSAVDEVIPTVDHLVG